MDIRHLKSTIGTIAAVTTTIVGCRCVANETGNEPPIVEGPYLADRRFPDRFTTGSGNPIILLGSHIRFPILTCDIRPTIIMEYARINGEAVTLNAMGSNSTEIDLPKTYHAGVGLRLL